MANLRYAESPLFPSPKVLSVQLLFPLIWMLSRLPENVWSLSVSKYVSYDLYFELKPRLVFVTYELNVISLQPIRLSLLLLTNIV